MKLTIKELAPYLPYRLKAIYNEENEENTIVDIYGVSSFDNRMHCQLKFSDGALGLFDEDFKPILRPLSDLTEGANPKLKNYFAFTNEGLIFKGKNECYTRLSDLEFLYENHFDVFGLIKKGLAVDINTLKQ